MRLHVPEVSTRSLVAGAALVAFLLRFPGLLWPVRPDEAGFTLVARHWHPQPDRLYGDYFVDRPPPIIALVKASDWIGGPLFIRFVAALGCVLLVVAAARTAYLLGGDRAARWTAVATAAVTTNTMIDAVAAKGEILGIPFVVGSFWLALEALRVLPASRRRALLYAFLAGLLGMTAVGLKQNMASGLAFGGAVLLVSALRKELSWPDFGRLSGGRAGRRRGPGRHHRGLVPGGRGPAGDALVRRLRLPLRRQRGAVAGVAGRTGLPGRAARGDLRADRDGADRRLVPGQPAARLAPQRARHGRHPAGAAGRRRRRGPRRQLLAPVPARAWCPPWCSAPRWWPARRRLRGRVMRVSVVLAAASCVLSMIGWVASNSTGVEPPTEIYTGQAIRDVSEPGDTIVVYGGRADIVMASGLESPYEHLWSLPMRTLDPELAGLSALLASDKRPTWFVEWVSFSDWDDFGNADFQAVLEENYEIHGDGCGHHIWLRKDVERAEPKPDCDKPWL